MQRWVCILRIIGDHTTSELAYECEDEFFDFNGDSQPDMILASKWWREPTDDPYNGLRNCARGAGWVFLMPKPDVFQQIQNATTGWGASHANSDVKMPLILFESDANLRVANPPTPYNQGGAQMWNPPDCGSPCAPPAHTTVNSVVKLEPVADLAGTGDLDGDLIPDLVVNAGYIYVDNSVETVTTGYFFFLSNEDFNHFPATGPRHLADIGGGAKPRYRADPGLSSLPIWDNTLVPIVLEPMDAHLVLHGDEAAKIDTLANSLFGMNLDNVFGLNDKNDMAITVTSTCARYSVIHVELNPDWRPGNSSGLGYDMHTWFANSSNQVPLRRKFGVDYNGTYVYDHALRLSAPFTTTPAAIYGLTDAGDYDLDGDNELSIVTYAVLFHPQQGYHGVGGSLIVNVQPPVSCSQGTPCNGMLAATFPLSATLHEIQGETPFDMASDTAVPSCGVNPPCAGDSSYPCDPKYHSPQYREFRAEPAWDLDGDGRVDVMARAAFFPKRLESVYCDDCACTLWVCPEENYYLDAGRDYIVLTPPAPPAVLWGVPLRTTTQVSFDASALVPPTTPYNVFPAADVKYQTTAGEWSAVKISYSRWWPGLPFSTFTATFPAAALTNPGTIKIPTRFHKDTTTTWNIAVP